MFLFLSGSAADGGALFSQPDPLFRVQVRCQLCKHLTVVVVQPCKLVFVQHTGQDRRGGNGHKGQRLKAQKGAVLVIGLVDAHQLVLDADAHKVGLVDAGLLGDHHAGAHPGGVAAVQGMGALVHIAHKADAVAGAAAVVDEVAPQGLPGDGVDHLTLAVIQPDGPGKVDVALQGPCVEALFVLGQLTQRIGAGDVGGAVHVGGTAVHQQKALLFQHSVIFRGGVVVHHGCIAAVGRNGAKALHKEFIVRTAVLVQDLVHGQFGQGLTGGKAVFQLHLEPHHGHSVPDMGLLCVGKLRFVLHALHQQQRVGAGPFNMQFLAKDNDIKVIECNLRASRSFPFVSKVLKYNFIDMATRIMLGEKVESLNKSVFDLDYVGVKASQFSFARLLKADPVLGVDMASTGEVGCIGENYYEAILKSMLSVGHRIPKKNILISSGPTRSKVELLNSTRMLIEKGYNIYSTAGTAKFFKENGIDTQILYWPDEDKEPNIMEYLHDRKIDLVINIPKNHTKRELDNGYK